jgi:hypothetical protein
MTKEEVIALAREAGLISSIANGFDRTNLSPAEARFAKLVVDAYSNKHSQLWRVCIEDAVKAERERIFDVLRDMHEKAQGTHNYYLHAVMQHIAEGAAN